MVVTSWSLRRRFIFSTDYGPLMLVITNGIRTGPAAKAQRRGRGDNQDVLALGDAGTKRCATKTKRQCPPKTAPRSDYPLNLELTATGGQGPESTTRIFLLLAADCLWITSTSSRLDMLGSGSSHCKDWKRDNSES
ncbi:uncharacterized protein [Physcomitrium patens]|uniref:uncharacterized protein n=1 Tax=Physcomitrium patens TaxID=3218 RepID=UPI00024AB316|nr:uncharacterized protein LOC112276575 [Physcomitrium patens]|eukprot:XP_024363756.1 uncharacterized protein LOC112276575 [Physcomitrella patens]